MAHLKPKIFSETSDDEEPPSEQPLQQNLPQRQLNIDTDLIQQPLDGFIKCSIQQIKYMEEQLTQQQLRAINEVVQFQQLEMPQIEYSRQFYFIKERKIMYNGQWKNGLPFGIGILYDFNSKSYYEGQMMDGYEHGQGRRINKDGYILQGNFVNGKYTPLVDLTNKPAKEYANICNEDQLNLIKNFVDQGMEQIVANQIPYQEMDQECENSAEKYYLYEKNVIYEGQWKNGVPYGYGKIYNLNDHTLYYGQVQDGQENGNGIKLKQNESPLKGFFDKGQFIQ